MPDLPPYFEEKFVRHLDLTGMSELGRMIANRQALHVIAGLLAAFVGQASPEARAETEHALVLQRERGRRRKKALQQAVDDLVRASASYCELRGLVAINPNLTVALQEEALRLLIEGERWADFHKQSRLGLAATWPFLLILEEFIQLASGHQLSLVELAALVTAAYRAVDPTRNLTVPDDLRGLEHFRSNQKNQVLCKLIGERARYLASTLHERPLLILRNGI